MLIAHNSKEIDLLARLMRAEAIGEGNLGMLMVGNVTVNRVLADCLTFEDINTLTDAIYQKNQFSGTKSPLFQSRSTTLEKELAERVLKGEYYHPATHALWFYAPSKNETCKKVWYEQYLSGQYKSHCFYLPNPKICKKIK